MGKYGVVELVQVMKTNLVLHLAAIVSAQTVDSRLFAQMGNTVARYPVQNVAL